MDDAAVDEGADRLRRMTLRGDAPIVPFLALPAVRLFLTSALLLFAELLFIRWIPSNIIYVGLFSNFLLMASFLGIGLGIVIGRARFEPRIDPAPLLLFLLIGVVLSGRLNVAPPTNDDMFIGRTPRELVDVNVFVLALIVVLVTASLAALARPLGPLLLALPPLRAYATDIAGSLAGIAALAGLAAMATPPLAWFVVLVALMVALAFGAPLARSWTVGAVALAAILALGVFDLTHGDRWSAYSRLTLHPLGSESERISVNGIPYQELTSATDPKIPPWFGDVYRLFPGRTFDRVLIIGAGAGTDTAVALHNGVGSVDAVDIDRVIVELGVARHPDRPYDDPRVRLHIDDGRAFLRRSEDRYDLIILAQTDSFTLVGNSANVRLESFLFTREAFESARDHLAPDGVFVMYNSYRESWLIDRYATTLHAAFGQAPTIRSYPEPSRVLLAIGPGVKAGAETAPAIGGAVIEPASDDWPFPYLRDRAIVPRYLLALALMLALGVAAVAGATRVARAPLGRFSPHFFVLGSAFLLLETRSLVTFSLLFGTTWLVNALTFFGILLGVLAAIGVNAVIRIPKSWPIYLALGVSLALNFLIPPDKLLLDPAWLRYTAAAALAFMPIFCANLAFTYSFRDTRSADMAFASNLLGAILGGVLEWSALVIGYRSEILIAAALYLLAFVLATRWRRLADRDLVRVAAGPTDASALDRTDPAAPRTAPAG